MKRRIKDKIFASTDFENTLVFTQNDVVSLLKAIDGLEFCKFALVDNSDGTHGLIINDSFYQIIDSRENAN